MNFVSHSRAAAAVLALFLLLSLPLAGCTNEGQALESKKSADETDRSATDQQDSDDEEKDDRLPVEVVRLEHGPIEAVLPFSGSLVAENDVRVYSQAARLVRELRAEEGDRVRKGQVMLRLQDEEQRSELKRIDIQLAKARREYQRQQKLHAQALISDQAMNDATYEVDQLELALSDAQRSLSYTEVRAPISGIVTGRHVNLGDTITVNQHLFDIVDPDSIVAKIHVPEKELKRLQPGLPARLYANSLDGDARRGKVARIAPVVDPSSGTVKVTVDVPPGQGLLAGMYVEGELVTATREDALLVPLRAVIYDQNQPFVYRLTPQGTAERLRLVPVLKDREHIEAAAGSGLEVGDLIVVAGQAGLKDGAKVRRIGADELAEAGS